MGSSLIIGLMLLMLYGCNAAGEREEDLSVSNSSSYGCSYCCSRIDNQTTVLNRISNASDELVGDVGKIKTGVLEDLPSQLERQTAVLYAYDTRLKEQELLLADLSRLVKEIHVSVLGPKDCSDIRALGYNTSGVYRVYPGNMCKPIEANVYCDMTTPGGNWLVFQRRKDGSVKFERTWSEYVNGFGNQTGEFWLGNELLYLLTSNRKYKLRIDLEDFDGQKRYAEYSTFSVSSSTDRYRLTVSGYTGDAGDSFSAHSGRQFSTKDYDNDLSKGSCSLLFRGGWWYFLCLASNLNGLYLHGPHTSYADGINWGAFRGYYYSLKTTEMKIAVAD